MSRNTNYNRCLNPLLLGLRINIGMFLLKKRASKISCEHSLLITLAFVKSIFFSSLIGNLLGKKLGIIFDI
jgi:hypothetical protein